MFITTYKLNNYVFEQMLFVDTHDIKLSVYIKISWYCTILSFWLM